MNPKVLTVLAYLGLTVCSSQAGSPPEWEHPFKHVPLQQSSVKTPSGNQLFRLKRVQSNRQLREIRIPEEEKGLQWLPGSLFKDIKLFGDEHTERFHEVYEHLERKLEMQRSGLLGAGGDAYEIENTLGLNFEYLLQLYCGENGDELSVTFDTGSDWTILQTADCLNCDGDIWDHEASSTFEQDHPFFELLYGSAQVYGWYAHDQFWLDDSKTFGVDSFDFMKIFYQVGISPSGGIMGFSRNKISGGYLPAGPLFYYYLYEAGATTDLVFASYLADHPTESFFQVGDYDRTGEYYTGDLVWLHMLEDFFWLSTTSAYIANGERYDFDEKYVELDTGTSLIYMDKKTGKKFMNKAAKGNRGFKWFGNWYLNCDLTRFESVFIEIGGYFFEIPPTSIVRNFEEYGYKWCDLGFRTWDQDDYWLVGDTLFHSYYNVWDEDGSRLGFALRSGSGATTQPYEKPVAD